MALVQKLKVDYLTFGEIADKILSRVLVRERVAIEWTWYLTCTETFPLNQQEENSEMKVMQ